MQDIGRFVWFDLTTTNVEEALAFYADALSWGVTPWDQDDSYTMLSVGGNPAAGVKALSDELKAMNVPPNWIASVRVEDVDASMKKAMELGGTTLKAAWDIPQVGRVAVLADPQGAAFMMFTPSEGAPELKADMMSWHELNTTDHEAAWTFYSKLLGWHATESMDMGEDGQYFMFQREGAEKSMGGMSNAAKKMDVPAHWLYYTTVDSCEGAIERIKSKGGKIANGPMQVPGGNWVAQCQDPQGAAFAIFSTAQ